MNDDETQTSTDKHEKSKDMSKELEYFPPNTGKWRWISKALNYSSWVCNLGQQMKPKTVESIWPADVILKVDFIYGEYVWAVKIVDWHHAQHTEVGRAASAEKAVAAAERGGEQAFRALTPEWVFLAIKNGWRSPLPKNNCLWMGVKT